MPKTKVVNLKYKQYDVYIGRGSPWGNPYRIPADGNRQEVIALYKQWLRQQPELLRRIARDLRGKRLGCFCKPLPCHGDILAFVADLTPEALENWLDAQPD